MSGENQIFAYAKTAELIIAFDIAARIVQIIFFCNPKFQAFYTQPSVAVKAGLCQNWSETTGGVFSHIAAQIIIRDKGNEQAVCSLAKFVIKFE